MKNLTDYNIEMYAKYTDSSSGPRLNGIACPDCGTELYDTKPLEIYATYPPRKDVHCVNCRLRGFRIA